MYNLKLELTEEQLERARTKAQELGFSDPEEYVRAVVTDALTDEITEADVIQAIKEGIREAHRGGGMSVEEFSRRMAEHD